MKIGVVAGLTSAFSARSALFRQNIGWLKAMGWVLKRVAKCALRAAAQMVA
jgi:hypothetical protein